MEKSLNTGGKVGMRLTEDQVLQDDKRFASCNALAELKFCGWEIPHRKSITNDEIRFYAWLCRSAIAMLKKQEVKYPVCEKCGKKIDHIITSVFNYDGSDSEYSFPITYNEDGGCIQFSTTQNWTGYELSDTEQKDSIRCPFCREFPFDANEEIELYEPEEVVVMMWEGR